MHRISRFVLPLLVVVAVFAQVTAAFAAPSAWNSVDVQVMTDDQKTVLLVAGQMPDNVTLPQQAELAVPAGAELQWLGEVLGGDASADPTLTYTKTTVGNQDIYSFTLTKGRIAQAEVVAPSITTFDGTNYATALSWTVWQDLPQVRVGARIPESAKVVQADSAASMAAPSGGYAYYSKTITNPKAGDTATLNFSYALGAAGQGTGAGGAAGSAAGSTTSSSDSIVLAAVLLAAVGGFGVLLFKVQRKAAAKAAAQQAAASKKRSKPATQVAAAAKKSARATRVDESAREYADEVVRKSAGEPAPARRIKPTWVMFAVVAALVLGFIIAGNKGTSASVVDGKISRNFGSASACQNSSIAFTVNPGVDLGKQGDEVLKGFEGMDGVGQVTIDIAQSKVDVGWCESSQTEDSVRQALSKSGLITLGEAATSSSDAAPAPVEATPSEDGKKQTVSVETSSGTFAPNNIVLKAGVPAELNFGAAVSCMTEVVIDQLGVRQDLTKGPATVKLDNPAPGTYTFVCGMGHKSGQIVVQ